LAGIQPDPQMPGFKKIIIKPAIVGNLTWVKANYNSIQGNIVSQWRRNGNNLTLHVEIPANTTATIYVPAVSPETVIEHGVQATRSEGIRFLRMENKVAVYELVSGNYNFTTIF
jgi:alpha-L-rhamnosidase